MKFGQKRRERFLAILRETANVSFSARQVGISRTVAYEHREADEAFAKEWDEAIEEAVDKLEKEARRRALHGVCEPIYYKGMRVGYKRVYSDTMMALLLKAHRPEKFKDRQEVTGNVTLRQIIHGLRDTSDLPRLRYPGGAPDEDA